MVLLPGGTFRMGARQPSAASPLGSPNVDPGSRFSESPVHEVTLDPFFLSKYEMTQTQYERIAGLEPSDYVFDGPDGVERKYREYPVQSVSWDECSVALVRIGFELPTEAQWEYAARGGTTTVWWSGDDRESLRGAVNIADLTAKRGRAPWPDILDWPDLDDGHAGPAPAGTCRANPYGLHEMTGNVWEWCRDRYGNYEDPCEEGTGLRISAAPTRVMRGGSFTGAATYTRSANRNHADHDHRTYDIGARPARAIYEKDYR
jgi:formylglycine-generating enzyme required for sulfatase activity